MDEIDSNLRVAAAYIQEAVRDRIYHELEIAYQELLCDTYMKHASRSEAERMYYDGKIMGMIAAMNIIRQDAAND